MANRSRSKVRLSLRLVLLFAAISLGWNSSINSDLHCQLDSDCDGMLSVEEVRDSGFFTSTDSNGDGTLGNVELRTLFERLGVPTAYVFPLVNKIDEVGNSKAGIQVGDITSHWNNRLESLLTVDDVGNWVAHAVRLGQYEQNFRNHVISGYDLASMLNEKEGMIMLEEIGVNKLIHRKQILRSIASRLLGIASPPSKPQLKIQITQEQHHSNSNIENSCSRSSPLNNADIVCAENENFNTALEPYILLEWYSSDSDSDSDNVDNNVKRTTSTGGMHMIMPIHKWRLYFRYKNSEEWSFIEEFKGDQFSKSINVSDLLLPAPARNFNVNEFDKTLGQFRIEAWNSIGRSDVAYATLHYDLHQDYSHSFSNSRKKNTFSPQNEFKYSLFNRADNDGDGDIDSSELENFVLSDLDVSDGLSAISGIKNDRSTLVDEIFKEEKTCESPEIKKETAFQQRQVKRAVEAAMKKMDSDGNNKKVILKKDMDEYWHSVAFTMTAQATAEWVKHAVNLGSEIANKFEEHSISGIDFPNIVEDDGETVLVKELGIENESHRRQIIRGVKLILMAIGQPPPQINLMVSNESPNGELGCGSMLLKWSNEDSSPIASVHKYILYRHKLGYLDTNGYSVLSQGNEYGFVNRSDWTEIYSGRAMKFVDTNLKYGAKYQYMMIAWNMLGSSPPFVSKPITPCRDGCGSIGKIVWAIVSFVVNIFYSHVLSPVLSGLLTLFITLLAVDRRKVFVRLKSVAHKLELFRVVLFVDKMWIWINYFGTIFYHVFMFISQKKQSTNQVINRNRMKRKSLHRSRCNSGELISAPIIGGGRSKSGYNILGDAFGFKSSNRSTVQTDDMLSVKSCESANSSSSGKRAKFLWKKLRNHVFNQSGGSFSDDESGSISDASSHASVSKKTLKNKLFFLRRKKKSSRKTKEQLQHFPSFKSHVSVDDPGVTYRGGARNANRALYPEEKMNSTIQLETCDPHTCNICYKTNLKRSHICGKCHGVFCSEHTAFKSHGRFSECKINSDCICIGCIS